MGLVAVQASVGKGLVAELGDIDALPDRHGKGRQGAAPARGNSGSMVMMFPFNRAFLVRLSGKSIPP